MIEFLKQLARQAGAMAYADQLRLTNANIHSKGNIRDLVTDTDRRVEDFISSELKKQFPDYGFYGEETGKSHSEREYCFVIDPIDGTASFVHGQRDWCISIGLTRNGKSVAGVIYQPTTDDLFYAEQGKGSFVNGTRMEATKRDNLGPMERRKQPQILQPDRAGTFGYPPLRLRCTGLLPYRARPDRRLLGTLSAAV